MNENPDGDNGRDNISQIHPLRSRENLYDYRDSPAGKMTKLPFETASLRSPSSLAITHTTKTGSQSSLRSAISLKETLPIQKQTNFDQSIRYTEKYDDSTLPMKNGNNKFKYEKNPHVYESYDKGNREFSIDSPESSVSSQVTAPKPAMRKIISPTPPTVPTPTPTILSSKSSRTHLIEGIPQTEV